MNTQKTSRTRRSVLSNVLPNNLRAPLVLFVFIAALAMSSNSVSADVTFNKTWGTVGTGPAQFISPIGIANDAAGNVYVADANLNSVKVFTANGDFLFKFGIPGAVDGGFISATGVAIDSQGYIYVTDGFEAQNNVQKFDPSGVYVSEFGGPGIGDGKFSTISAIAIDEDDNVYVSDTSTGRIQKFDTDGNFILKWGGVGSTDGLFQAPRGIAVDSDGDVYVADTNNHRVQKFTSTGTFITKWGTSGSGDGQFTQPSGVDVDHLGNVRVVDQGNHRFQRFTKTGTFIDTTGAEGSAPGQFFIPRGISSDELGNVYITDLGNSRVQKFGCETVDFSLAWGTAGSGPGQFNTPMSVAVDPAGNVYVVDNGNNRVQKFAPDGTFILQWGGLGPPGPAGDGFFISPLEIAADNFGNIYVGDQTNRVQKFDTNGNFILKWGIPGAVDGGFVDISGIAVNAAGDVYVCDNFKNDVQKFDSSGNLLLDWGVSSPSGVAVDGAGNVYVSLLFANQIKKFTSTGTLITTWGSSGTGDGQMDRPFAVSVDQAGSVYVADFFNHRIQKFSSSGAFITKWGTNGSGDGQFNQPRGVWADTFHNVYVADSGTNRIQKFGPTPPTANAGPDQTVECNGATTNVTLDGSASVGDALTYKWTEGATVLGTTAILNTSLPNGLHTITLTVDDGCNGIDTDTVEINVTATPPVANAGPDQTIACAGASTNVTLDGTASTGDALTYEWKEGATVLGTGATLNVSLPPGSHTITLTVDDGCNGIDTDTVQVNLVSDGGAPSIVLKPSIVLTPPNHQYATITIANLVQSVSDGCDTGVSVDDVVITQVSSDEPENGPNDGNTVDDIIIAANCQSVQLRRERDSASNGRVYTITLKLTDSANNSTTVNATVSVRINPGTPAVAGPGTGYTETSSCP